MPNQKSRQCKKLTIHPQPDDLSRSLFCWCHQHQATLQTALTSQGTKKRTCLLTKDPIIDHLHYRHYYFSDNVDLSPLIGRDRGSKPISNSKIKKKFMCARLVEIVCDSKLVLVDWCSIWILFVHCQNICCHCLYAKITLLKGVFPPSLLYLSKRQSYELWANDHVNS